MSERSAMQMTAVYSCVRILAEAIASLPLHIYRKEKSTEKIYGAVATVMALDRALHCKLSGESVYDERGIFVI